MDKEVKEIYEQMLEANRALMNPLSEEPRSVTLLAAAYIIAALNSLREGGQSANE